MDDYGFMAVYTGAADATELSRTRSIPEMNNGFAGAPNGAGNGVGPMNDFALLNYGKDPNQGRPRSLHEQMFNTAQNANSLPGECSHVSIFRMLHFEKPASRSLGSR